VRILTINSGSSSIKFSAYGFPGEQRELSGELSRIGHADGAFRIKDSRGALIFDQKPNLPDHPAALKILLNWLGERDKPDAIGHRIVHGGPDYRDPRMITLEVIQKLRALIPLAPNHLPREIEAVEAILRVYPETPQVACFDTAFHRSMPDVAQIYALPESVRNNGVLLRYGFHGLSYEYIAGELERMGAAKGRVIVCHLGNGASMAAMRDGKSIDTTMGFTPTGGLVMSTRCGDIDPEVMLYLMEEMKMDPKNARETITRDAGMLGLSTTSGDMQDLHRREKEDPKAALAIAVFCYSARKAFGALAAVLGGLDTLVFTGGIGENDAAVRLRICDGFEFLGVRLDPRQNESSADVISASGASAAVRVMKTNEELSIARHTARLITGGGHDAGLPNQR
jgi:acetate kinase